MRVLKNNNIYIPSPEGILLDGWLNKWTILKDALRSFKKIIRGAINITKIFKIPSISQGIAINNIVKDVTPLGKTFSTSSAIVGIVIHNKIIKLLFLVSLLDAWVNKNIPAKPKQ